MVRTLLTAALTAGLVIGTTSTAFAEDVCVCVTARGPSIQETTTGHQCQPTSYRTWEHDVDVPGGVVYVGVWVKIPAGSTQ